MSSYSNPAQGAVEISGSAQSLDQPGRALLITVTGDITFTTAGGNDITWEGCPVGIHAITVKSIANGATVTGYILR